MECWCKIREESKWEMGGLSIQARADVIALSNCNFMGILPSENRFLRVLELSTSFWSL